MEIDGDLFETEDDYLKKCKDSKSDRTINIEKNLSRIYQIGFLRTLSEKLGLSLTNFNKHNITKGQSSRYKLASYITKNCANEKIATKLQEIENTLYFPFISYFTIPKNSTITTKQNFLKLLEEKGHKFENNKCHLFNGFIDPPSRYPKLELIQKVDQENIISMTYSCTRVLFSPESDSKSYRNSFLCRVPIIVRVLFDRQLIEVSIPYFYDHFSSKLNENRKYPERFQQLFENINVVLTQLFSSKLGGIDYSNLALHLEQQCSGVDMGWLIEPQDSATFDVKQNAIPLKTILSEFESTLSKECTALGVKNPLEDYKLYSIFRAIKEQGHTSQLILKIPLGLRGKKVTFILIYGAKNTGFPPIIRISHYDSAIINKIRLEVWKQTQIPKRNNPYTLFSLLTNNKE